jgi:hypothetical protein
VVSKKRRLSTNKALTHGISPWAIVGGNNIKILGKIVAGVQKLYSCGRKPDIRR